MLSTTQQPDRTGLTIIELLAALALIGVLGVIVITRTTSYMGESDKQACQVNVGDIELQSRLWRRNEGNWPAANLADIGIDSEYFPSGLPTCPVDGSSYTIDITTGKVVGHAH